jgi:glutamine amidotransferase
MVVIIDYGVGNAGSIRNMLKAAGTPAMISSRAEDIEAADRLILPGVGAFDTAMRSLAETGLVPALTASVRDRGVPVLGICLGMQLLTRGSTEGQLPGLGWIDAETVRFQFDGNRALNIPHMGWNSVTPTPGSRLFHGLAEESRFYFVHSFHVVCDSRDVVAAECQYGYPFAAAVEQRNVFGTQFHPEKSHRFGLALLRNFVSMTAAQPAPIA